MRSTVFAVVLCIFATAAGAQCVAQAPAAGAARPGAELIKTASAGTRPMALAPDDGVASMRKTPEVKTDDKHPRRTGSAMLLAALAVMSGIALRRFSARSQ